MTDQPFGAVAAVRRLRRVMVEIAAMPANPEAGPALPHLYTEETVYLGRPYDMPLVTLDSRRCRWLRVGGGCTTCNYNQVASVGAACTGAAYSEALLAQVDRAAELFPPDRYPFWTLSTAGSFFDDDEIPHATRLLMLRRLRERGYRALNFESRPEYCRDEAHLEGVVEAFGGDLSVSIGLESYSDAVRGLCLNKGYPTRVFTEASQALGRAGIAFNCYVLLGKPLLGAWLADDGTATFDWALHLAEAQRTIRFALDAGAELAILMLANLQPDTLSYWLFRAGCYVLPSPWLAVEAIRALSPAERGRVVLKGLMRAMPHPLAHAVTCPACIGAFRRAHMAFNEGAAFEDSLARQWCMCRSAFEETLKDSRSAAVDFDPDTRAGQQRLDQAIQAQIERNLDVLLASALRAARQDRAR
jgi:radical SAM enzyme (TIGR01210 family)